LRVIVRQESVARDASDLHTPKAEGLVIDTSSIGPLATGDQIKDLGVEDVHEAVPVPDTGYGIRGRHT
jgi:hypothetical protein